MEVWEFDSKLAVWQTPFQLAAWGDLSSRTLSMTRKGSGMARLVFGMNQSLDWRTAMAAGA
jgi:hypothetical protein